MEKGLFKFSVRDITEIAVMCALAIAIDRLLNIKVGATGGSVSIACLPLFFVAFRHGWFKGFIASGVVFSLTTCLLDGYGFQFFVFDYFIAFGCIGIAGLFGKIIYKKIESKIIIDRIIAVSLIIASVLIYSVIRLFSASVDSMIFYELSLGASLAYNISYIGPSAIALVVFLIILVPALIAVNTMYPTEYLKDVVDKNKEIEEEKTNLDV